MSAEPLNGEVFELPTSQSEFCRMKRPVQFRSSKLNGCWLAVFGLLFMCVGCSAKTEAVVESSSEEDITGWYEQPGPWKRTRSLRLGQDKSVLWISEPASGAPLDVIEGTYVVDRGVITLDSDVNVNGRAEQWQFIPIRWDRRTYLVAPCYLLFFSLAQEVAKPAEAIEGGYWKYSQERVAPRGPGPVKRTEFSGEIVDVSEWPSIRAKRTCKTDVKPGMWAFARGPNLNEGWGSMMQIVSVSGDEVELRANLCRFGAMENVTVGNEIAMVFEVVSSPIKY